MNRRILYTTADASPQSGAFRSLIAMSRGIKGHGFDPILVLHKEAEDTPLLTEQERRNAHFLQLPRLKRNQPLAYYLRCISTAIQGVDRIARFIHEDGISIVHVNEITDIYGGLAAKVAGVPCVWHIRCYLGEPWLAWLLPRVVQILATRIIAVSNSVAEHMFDKQRISRQKVRIIHDPGPDSREFHPGVDGQPFRQELAIEEDAFLVGMVGKLGERKGHEVLIRAACRVLVRFPNAFFLIVGGTLPGKHHSAYAQRLARLTSDLGLSDRVIFTGFRSDIPQIMAACDVVVHCSTYPDPFPGVVLQGMAMEKPVITASLGGASEQVGEAGVSVRPSDPDALAEAIIALSGDHKKRESLGRMAAERAATFSDASFYEALLSLYEEVTSGKGGR
jgi:glycosyltransferase involved in cell wall biosynthesis